MGREYEPEIVGFDQLAADPPTANLIDGCMWFNDTEQVFKVFRNGAIFALAEFQMPITKVFGDYAVAALTTDIEIYSLPAAYKLIETVTKHSIEWTGTGVVTLESTVGIAADLSKFIIDPFVLTQAVGNKIFDDSVVGSIESFGAATSIRSSLTATGANLDQLLTGSVTYYLTVRKVT